MNHATVAAFELQPKNPPMISTFSQTDTFQGDVTEPQSLHKYAYVHGDPIQGIDPTGKFFTVALIGLLSGAATATGLHLQYDKAVITAGGAILASGLSYLGFVQMGNISRMWLGGQTEHVKIYVRPLEGLHINDPTFTNYRAWIF
jgi:hypothetical protein